MDGGEIYVKYVTILKRDNGSCKICQRRDRDDITVRPLHSDTMNWDIPASELALICIDCFLAIRRYRAITKTTDTQPTLPFKEEE